MSQTCLECAQAQWKRTAAGRLHPSGDGRCMWTPTPVVLPKAFYWVGGERTPAGGYIDRNAPKADCPLFYQKEAV